MSRQVSSFRCVDLPAASLLAFIDSVKCTFSLAAMRALLLVLIADVFAGLAQAI